VGTSFVEHDGSQPGYPGAEPPARRRTVDSHGVELAVYEWGAPDAPALLLVHGGFDFARTFDVFAPLLAAAGYRVVSYDHRGHGDSQHAELYSWIADARDLLTVADSVADQPFPVVGHSKGGSLVVYLIQAEPHRFSRFVAIDGLPFRRQPPDVAERERSVSMAQEIAGWLDHRRKAATLTRTAGTLQELAQRRARMNPRLGLDWLRYLASVGARHDPDGYRWKIDPALRMGGFGPFRSRWTTDRLPGFPVPLLALLGGQDERMSWGVRRQDLEPYLPPHAEVQVLASVGHFIHIERPQQTAALVLDFLREQKAR